MGMAEELLKSILDPASSGLDPPPDTAVGRGLAGYTGKIINLMRVKVFVNIGNPGHFPLPGPHVWGRHIAAGTDITLFNQFPGKAPGNGFQILFVVKAGIDD
jgi:hypothetical protein